MERMKSMELRQLEYFYEVAKYEHVTAAAEQLHVAQSAVSRQIQLLEQELGISLFVREGKHVKLSLFGRRFLPQVERTLRSIEAGKREAEHYLNPNAGIIKLGFPHSLGIQFVPKLLSSFRTLVPEVHFDLVLSRVSDLLKQLADGQIDLAMVTPWDKDSFSGQMSGEFLFHEKLRIIVPENHTLANRTSIRLDELKDESFILFKPGYTLRDVVWDACQKTGFSPKISLEAEETDIIRAFVRAGLGISLLPVTEVIELQGLREIAIEGEPLERSVGIVWWNHTSLSAVAKRFAEFVSTRAKETISQQLESDLNI